MNWPVLVAALVALVAAMLLLFAPWSPPAAARPRERRQYGPQPAHGESLAHLRFRRAGFYLLVLLALGGPLVVVVSLGDLSEQTAFGVAFVLSCLAGIAALALLDNLIAALWAWLGNGGPRWDSATRSFVRDRAKPPG